MDASRILTLLLLLPSIFGAALCLNNQQGPHFGQHSWRTSLNEYLAPPPPPSPPRPHPHVRTGRVVNPRPTQAPGYFSKWMSWLNPFNVGSSVPPTSVSPPHSEISFPPLPKYLPPRLPQGPPVQLPPPGPPLNLPPPAPAAGTSPPGPPLPVYNTPLSSSYNRQPELLSRDSNPRDYLPRNKWKNCNPCNRMPWVPLQTGEMHAEGPSYGASPKPLPPSSNGYLPPSDFQVSRDVHYAASQKVRVLDFSQIPVGQTGPLPNPLLYPGPMPPLYKSEPFYRPSLTPPVGGSGEYLEPPLLHANGIGTNYPLGPTIPEEYGPPVGNKPQFNSGGSYEQRDLASSDTQVNQNHVSGAPQNQDPEINNVPLDYKGLLDTSVADNYAPDSVMTDNQGYNYPQDSSLPKQELHGPPTHLGQDYPSYFSSFEASDVSNQNFVNPGVDQNSLQSIDQRYPGSSQEKPGVGNILDLATQHKNPSGSYGWSGFDSRAVPNGNNLKDQHREDLSSSDSAAESFHVTVEPSITSSSSSSADSPLHFEESPLLDFTKKDDSREDINWSTTTMNSLTGLTESLGYTAKTATQYQQFHSSADQLLSLNNALQSSVSAASNSENTEYKNSHSSETYEDNQQDISYIAPSDQLGYFWPSLLSTTLKPMDAYRDPSDTALSSTNVNVDTFRKEPETNTKEVNRRNQPQQSIKRTKQVQVIIPYTSDYTPLPFHREKDWSANDTPERTERRRIPYFNDLNNDNYVSQKSRSEIRVVNQPDLQNNFSTASNSEAGSTTPLPTSTEHLSKNISTKANNSIDVHRLQKNIDNWTIQEYSKTLTSSTVLPSSAHPYLLPSKKIPSEYLTTTEPGDHVPRENDRENIKIYSLADFSFNDLDHEGSASNQVEGSRVQVIRVEEPKTKLDSASNSSTSTSKGATSWNDFSVSLSPLKTERVYVVTPQTVTTTTAKISFEKDKKREEDGGNPKDSKKQTVTNTKKSKNRVNDFDAIERAYQVLPHAVNNLAVASTGKESVPLWGIMEHEEFVSMHLENAEDGDSDVIDGPVLYAGHSKVSRGKR